MRILYDGWSILYQPNGPAATHLLSVLAQLPEDIEPIVALPGPAPAWFSENKTKTNPTANTVSARLRWEQRILPKIAVEAHAKLLHLMSTYPPLLGSMATVVSPTEFNVNHTFTSQVKQDRKILSRLREAFRQGGLSRAKAIFWPSDLPKPKSTGPIVSLPPSVHPDFTHYSERDGGSEIARNLGLPETYILYHGPYEIMDLNRLLAAWSWAAGPIGEYYPLVVLGLDDSVVGQFTKLLDKFEIKETVRILPSLPPTVIPHLYRRCSALFHPAPVSPWGGPVRHALACGKVIVAAESSLADAMVGAGAYLIPIDDLRQLGAALITSIVEEQVAESLSRAARQQADSWQAQLFRRELAISYRNLVSG